MTTAKTIIFHFSKHIILIEVSGIYETGKALIDVGVIPGSDITPGFFFNQMFVNLKMISKRPPSPRSAMSLARITGVLTKEGK